MKQMKTILTCLMITTGIASAGNVPATSTSATNPAPVVAYCEIHKIQLKPTQKPAQLKVLDSYDNDFEAAHTDRFPHAYIGNGYGYSTDPTQTETVLICWQCQKALESWAYVRKQKDEER